MIITPAPKGESSPEGWTSLNVDISKVNTGTQLINISLLNESNEVILSKDTIIEVSIFIK